VAALSYRSCALLMLCYPDAALLDADHALKDAREIGQAAGLMYALWPAGIVHLGCGNIDAAAPFAQGLLALAEEKRAFMWKVGGRTLKGCILAAIGKGADAVQALTSALEAWRSTAATVFAPIMLSYLAMAHLSLKNVNDASQCIGEAIKAVKQTKEAFWDAECNRISGQILLSAAQPDIEKAEAQFTQAVAIARQHKQNPGNSAPP
jgi:predicted ATPase